MTDWEALLKEAAERVQQVTDKFLKTGNGTRNVGRGAGGDETLLIDREAENQVLDVFSGFKGLRIISEERGEIGGKREAEWTLVADPIDGSSNFEEGIPFYCTSLALLDGPRLANLKYALVRNLVNGEMYYAEAGNGSTKDGTRIKTSDTRELGEAAILVDNSRASLQKIMKTAPLLASVRRQAHFGANALEVCFVAEGKMDCFVDVRGRMRITDSAGGYLIAKEAGAVISSADGNELDPPISIAGRFGLVASANEALHKKVLKKIL